MTGLFRVSARCAWAALLFAVLSPWQSLAQTPAPPVTNGLQLWLDAAALNPKDHSEIRSGAYVEKWPSLTSNGIEATQRSVDYQPRLLPNALNGMPVVRFGSRGFLTTTLNQISGDKSIFIVHRRSEPTGGAEIASNGGTGMFLGYMNGYEAVGRLGVSYDLLVPGSITTALVESVIRSGNTETLTVDGSTISTQVADDASGYYTLSSKQYPYCGEIAEVLVYNRALSNGEAQSVETYLSDRWWVSDIRSVTPDLVAPTMELGNPAPDRRVKQTTAGYEGTQVYHTLYLPKDWVPGRRFPVIVDYAPNAYNPSDGDIPTTGAVEDISLGYGITGGRGFIWICMPTIGGSPLANQPVWWGDLAQTENYTLQTIRYVCQKYGGDPSAIIMSGFSRGAIACNYLGLNDDTIADVWLAFIPHAHYDGQFTNWGYANDDDASAKVRLQRLDGRWQHISEELPLASPQAYLESTGVSMAPFTLEKLPYYNHCDIWALRPIQLRTDLRAWLAEVVAEKPGTHTMSGSVVTGRGLPIAGAEVDSGPTHFAKTDSDGRYIMRGLIDSTRTVTVTSGKSVFPAATVTIDGADVSHVNFRAE